MSALGVTVRGARVLDLFAGSGALGIETLSRGASHCVFVEKSRKASDTIRANLAMLQAEDRARVIVGDAARIVDKLERREYDLALADPPYDRGLAEPLVRQFLDHPFARELWVEHRTGELNALPGLTGRRYGDTTLTTVRAPDEP